MVRYVLLVIGCLLAFGGYAEEALTASTAPAVDAATRVEEDISSVVRQFKAEGQFPREYPLAKISEAYAEDQGNPALRLERMLSHDRGTMLELLGLNRDGKKYSAIIDTDHVYLQAIKSGVKYKLLLQLGGSQVEGKGGKKLLQLMPGERLYLFFEPIDDFQGHSLRYTNWNGKADSYFDVIDPRFRERYDAAHSKAVAPNGSVDDMRNFLLEFARNDPDMRAQKVFVGLINKLHSLNTFDGHYQAYQLLKDPADEKAARKLARSAEQLAKLDAAVLVVRQAEAAKQEAVRRAQEERIAEQRKRDEARVAELKKQEEINLAERQAAQAKAEEEKCMRTPACRRAWEAQQAKCEQEILSCRSNCNRVAGVDRASGFLATLSASGLARVCYGGCKCGSGFGALLGKFNTMVAENQASTASAGKSSGSPASKGSSPSESNQKTYECKVYCRSTDGPLAYPTVKAGSRREAASAIASRVNEICAAEFKTHASRASFSESQCWEK